MPNKYVELAASYAAAERKRSNTMTDSGRNMQDEALDRQRAEDKRRLEEYPALKAEVARLTAALRAADGKREKGRCDSEEQPRLLTVCQLEVTPRCQQVHGGLHAAIVEAGQRAAKSVCDVAQHECNRGSHFHLMVKMERKPQPPAPAAKEDG